MYTSNIHKKGLHIPGVSIQGLSGGEEGEGQSELLKKRARACNDVSKPLDERRHIYWIFRKLSERNSPPPFPAEGKWIKGLLHAQNDVGPGDFWGDRGDRWLWGGL